MPPALTYSLLALCAATFLSAFWLEGKKGSALFPRLARLGIVLQIASVGAAYMVLRPGKGTDGRAAIARNAAAGKPVMIDLYGNY